MLLTQNFHPALHPGHRLTARHSTAPVFSRQSALDSACVLHCIAMAAVINGVITDPGDIPWRQRGPEAQLWSLFCERSMEGMSPDETLRAIHGLSWGWTATVSRGPHAQMLEHAASELRRGRLVILYLRWTGCPHWHASLAVGTEQRRHAASTELVAVLALDPAEPAPAAFASYNARLEVRQRSGTRPRSSVYVTSGHSSRTVLAAAVAIRTVATSRRPRSKPP